MGGTAVLDSLIKGYQAFFKSNIDAQSNLQTVLGDKVFVADDCSLMTQLELGGLLVPAGGIDFDNSLDNFEQALASSVDRFGHRLKITIGCDPELALQEVNKLLYASRKTAKNHGLDIDPLYDDWSESLAPFCHKERVLIDCWTHPGVLSPLELKSAQKNTLSRAKDAPYAADGSIQHIESYFEEMIPAHKQIVTKVLSGFKNMGAVCRNVPTREALAIMRESLFPEITGPDWEPLLPGDPLPMAVPWPDSKNINKYFLPALRKQIFPLSGEDINLRYCRIGDRYHAPIKVTVGPQKLQDFSQLFSRLRSLEIPWRISFMIQPNGPAHKSAVKSLLASILWATSPNNKRLRNAYQAVDALRDENIAQVGLQITLDTWTSVPANDTDEAVEKKITALRSQASRIIGELQSWGGCDGTDETGNPTLGAVSAAPGFSYGSIANKLIPPLRDVLEMLPLTRPAFPWKEGNIPTRTMDGKLMPFQLGTGLQASWNEMGIAPMGGGKSVLLNLLNWSFLTLPGFTEIPYLSIFDFGPSSKGLVQLFKANAPKHLQHVAEYYRLRMEDKYAINPFDTPVGYQTPIISHAAFLKNFLCLLCTPLGKSAPYDGVTGVIGSLVEEVFEEFSIEKNSKRYSVGLNTFLDDQMRESGIEVDHNTCWWDVVTAFGTHGMIREASLAQRYAVPLLPDFSARVKQSPRLRQTYTLNTPNGEPILDYVFRSLSEAISEFPIICKPTRLEIAEETRIISFDLDEVCPRGGERQERQAGLMFMLARHAAVSRFFQMPEDALKAPVEFREYHINRVDTIRRVPKRWAIDEAHRFTKNGPIVDQLVGDLSTAIREGRKWNLFVSLWSQDLHDIPVTLRKLMTSAYFLSGLNHEAATECANAFALGNAGKEALIALGKPGRHGAEMVAWHKTDKGISWHPVVNTMGKQFMWAFSTTTEDAYVVKSLYEAIGPRETLSLLAKMKPSGSIKDEMKQRQEEAAVNLLTGEEMPDILKEMIKELLQAHHEMAA